MFKKNIFFFKHILKHVVSLCRVYIGSMIMISINTNYGGLFAGKAVTEAQKEIDQAMVRLSTGKRINHSKDDSAGQAIAMRMEAEIRGLAVASRNASDGQSFIDTADSALGEVRCSMLVRMRELAVQSQNGTLQTSDKLALGVEFDALEAEITRISDSTSWAGIKILDGTHGGGISFRIGELREYYTFNTRYGSYRDNNWYGCCSYCSASLNDCGFGCGYSQCIK